LRDARDPPTGELADVERSAAGGRAALLAVHAATLELLAVIARSHHRTHLVRSFRAHHGVTIGTYARRLRIQ
jgi:transcriptional regulator GlxA family with amidase domain